MSNDISIHCVLGIHHLLRLGGTIDLVNGELSYSKINHKSVVTLHPPGNGLQENVSFYNTTHIIPLEVYFNIVPSPTFLRRSIVEDFVHSITQSIYSDYVIVERLIYQGKYFTVLEYVSHSA